MGRSGKEYAQQHIQEYRNLSKKLGPILDDVLDIFYSLNEKDREDLFNEYGKIYSLKAKEYAIEAFPLWKNKVRHMSGQTAERMINLIPPRLSFSERHGLVEKLYKFHLKHETKYISVNSDSPEEGICAIKKIIQDRVDYIKKLCIPSDIGKIVEWVNDNNATISIRILRLVSEKIYLDIMKEEVLIVNKILQYVRNKEIKDTIYCIQLPSITINVLFYKPSIVSKVFRFLFGG